MHFIPPTTTTTNDRCEWRTTGIASPVDERTGRTYVDPQTMAQLIFAFLTPPNICSIPPTTLLSSSVFVLDISDSSR